MKILSCFDGISGCQQAFKNLGIEFDGVDNQYYASEIDKYAIQITQKNFPNTIQLGDVKLLNKQSIPFLNTIPDSFQVTLWGWRHPMFSRSIDLLVAGFPCQDLSIAKKDGKGLNGERSGLFYELLRIIKEVKPKHILIENVASMKKEWKEKISQELGFGFTEINSALLTAQQRRRCYWVAKLQNDGTYKKVDIEQPQYKGMLLKDIIESGLPYQEKSHSLTASYNGAAFWNSLQKKQRSMILEPISCAIRGRYNSDRQSEQRLELRNDNKVNCITTVDKDSLVCEPIRLGHFNKGGQGDRIYSIEGKSVSLSANGGGRFAKTGGYRIDLPDGDYIVRKLTPIECEKLQGFPVNYTEGIANTNRYKALGNSFTVPVIEHILKTLFDL